MIRLPSTAPDSPHLIAGLQRTAPDRPLSSEANVDLAAAITSQDKDADHQ
jgi:hypothetical protein